MIWWIMAFAAWHGTNPVSQVRPACDELYAALSAVPHVTLTRSDGPFVSLWDGAEQEGCEVDLETNDSLLAGSPAPDLTADPGTDLYEAGWRMIPEILADGAGSGTYGIRRGTTTCVVSWEQPSYIDDTGELVVSETLSIRVQCAEQGGFDRGAPGRAPPAPGRRGSSTTR